MKEKYDKELCIRLLTDAYKRIRENGETRYPARSDFSDEEVCAIKALLGPWPRALETASIKPERDDDRKRLNVEKRIRAKHRLTEEKKKNK